MKSHRPAIGLILVLAIAGIALVRSRNAPDSTTSPADVRTSRAAGEQDSTSTKSTEHLLRNSGRVRTDTSHWTHSPAQLQDFFLRPIDLQDATLADAIPRIMESYREACAIAGEVPLDLSFEIPAGPTPTLTLHLPGMPFSAALKYIATLSGRKVTREGLAFSFPPFANDGARSAKLQVPPDFASFLATLKQPPTSEADPFGNPPITSPQPRRTIAELLTDLGIHLDPSTTVHLGPNGELTIDSKNPADTATISTLAKHASAAGRPQQVKFTSKVIKLPSTTPLPGLPLGSIDSVTLDRVTRELAQENGSDIATMPSITARAGQNATIEMIHEVIYPDPHEIGSFYARNVGVTLSVKPEFIGFGQHTDLDYLDIAAEPPAADGSVQFNELAHINGKNYATDGGAHLMTESHPDGSTTVLLITSEKIDATGRPVRDPAP